MKKLFYYLLIIGIIFCIIYFFLYPIIESSFQASDNIMQSVEEVEEECLNK